MTTSRSDHFSPNMEKGTDELRDKHSVVAEALDYRGLMQRARVLDQTSLDILFLERKITAPQHSAGECFLDVLVRSGGTPRSCDPSAVSFGTLRDAERSLSSRIMVASGAYRVLSREPKDVQDATIIVVTRNVRPNVKLLSLIRRGLNALVGYFGTAGARDPRNFK
jgi:hypothetical protein